MIITNNNGSKVAELYEPVFWAHYSPGGNGFVLAGCIAVTTPSWRVNGGPASSVTAEAGIPTFIFSRSVRQGRGGSGVAGNAGHAAGFAFFAEWHRQFPGFAV